MNEENESDNDIVDRYDLLDCLAGEMTYQYEYDDQHGRRQGEMREYKLDQLRITFWFNGKGTLFVFIQTEQDLRTGGYAGLAKALSEATGKPAIGRCNPINSAALQEIMIRARQRLPRHDFNYLPHN